jgi:DNA (cytosine-5)-methyltransferase 1
MFNALDFFCGSGLVRLGLDPSSGRCGQMTTPEESRCIPGELSNGRRVPSRRHQTRAGRELPKADLAWASFPCQDLSLAGAMTGLKSGTRSGLFWQWLRVLDEMHERPPVLAAETVVGFLIADDGLEFKNAYNALRDGGYRAMSHAVAVLVTRWLTRQLLAPLASRSRARPRAVALRSSSMRTPL